MVDVRLVIHGVDGTIPYQTVKVPSKNDIIMVGSNSDDTVYRRVRVHSVMNYVVGSNSTGFRNHFDVYATEIA